MRYEFRLPDIGEGLHEAEILNWFVAVGDVIRADENVVEVQTDKAVVEIASPVAGKVVQLGGNLGDLVKVEELLVAVETEGAETGTQVLTAPADQPAAWSAGSVESAAGTLTTAPAAPTKVPGAVLQPSSRGDAGQAVRVLAAPAVRKLARDLGVDLSKVTPSDERGHVSKFDVEQYLQNHARQGTEPGAGLHPEQHRGHHTDQHAILPQAAASGTAAVDDGFTVYEGEERQPIRGLRRRIYENMMKSMSRAPQATGMDELDVSRLVEVRERMLAFASAQSIKLTYLPFIIKAVTHVLRENPIFNASVDDEKMEIVYKKHIHVGVATATPDGLLVPVIRHANHKSVFQIARELQDLSQRGRNRKLKSEELSGSTFTISSTGARGGWFATPILNYPEVAILGVHSIAKKAVVLEDDSIVAKHMMGFSLTFDHRVIDGEPAGAFMSRFKEILENPELLMVL